MKRMHLALALTVTIVFTTFASPSVGVSPMYHWIDIRSTEDNEIFLHSAGLELLIASGKTAGWMSATSLLIPQGGTQDSVDIKENYPDGIGLTQMVGYGYRYNVTTRSNVYAAFGPQITFIEMEGTQRAIPFSSRTAGLALAVQAQYDIFQRTYLALDTGLGWDFFDLINQSGNRLQRAFAANAGFQIGYRFGGVNTR